MTNENILLRGTTLKLAPIVYGCAIYTGSDTKMMKNSIFQSNKISSIEKYLKFYRNIVFLEDLFKNFQVFWIILEFKNIFD